MEPFNYFDKIFCINLDRRQDRWEHSQDEFNKVGIQGRVERFPAIEHKNGAAGCLMSHVACIKKAKELNLNNVLVFEDDVKFINSDIENLRLAIDTLKKIPDWDLFYLGGRLMKMASFISPHLIESRLWSAHAYAVNRCAFGRCAAPYLPIDIWYSYHMKSYCIYPLMAVQREGFSDIENREVSYKESAFRSTFESLAQK